MKKIEEGTSLKRARKRRKSTKVRKMKRKVKEVEKGKNRNLEENLDLSLNQGVEVGPGIVEGKPTRKEEDLEADPSISEKKSEIYLVLL